MDRRARRTRRRRLAWSTGKQVFARDPNGEIRTLAAPSSVRGLAFLPKGYRLAISHYNGASLWFPNAAAAPDELNWKGSHLDITVSPDGRFVVTAMQENALHAWRIADKKDLRLSGYPGKPRSLSWSSDGQWLATSGAEAAIVWPFNSKEGPVNKAPLELGVSAGEGHLCRLSPEEPCAGARLCRRADPAGAPARWRRASGARGRGTRRRRHGARLGRGRPAAAVRRPTARRASSRCRAENSFAQGGALIDCHMAWIILVDSARIKAARHEDRRCPRPRFRHASQRSILSPRSLPLLQSRIHGDRLPDRPRRVARCRAGAARNRRADRQI